MKFSEIIYPERYYFNALDDDKVPSEVISYDTETLNGYCRLLCDSNGDYLLPNNFDEMAVFLTQGHRHKTLNTFFNIDFDVRAIIKYLSPEQQHQLYYVAETIEGDYTIKWLPGKMFQLKTGRRAYRFYDISQFYNSSLEVAGQKYLNAGKDDYDVSNLTEWHFKEDIDTMRRYCIKDCKLTRDLTELQVDKFNKIGISFKKPISKAYMSELYCMQRVKIPRPSPTAIQRLAFYAYSGGRFELTQRGYFDKVYCYDINSAYPNIIKDLPNPFDCVYFKARDFIEDAVIGYYDITLYDNYNEIVSPITAKQGGINVYPNTDKRRLVVSQPELKFIEDNLKLHYDINDAYILHSDTDVKPFKYVEDLYRLRKEIEPDDPLHAKTIKIILNSLYGKFWQVTKLLEDVTGEAEDFDFMYSTPEYYAEYKKKYKAGYLFNPAFAAHITASTRVQLLEGCKGHEHSVIGFHTDSIITTEPFMETSTELGGWDLETEGEGVFLGTGLYTIRNDNSIKHRRRGGTSKNINSWFDVIEANPTSVRIPQALTHVVTLGDIINFNHTYHIEDLNTFTTLKRTIDVKDDTKRNWLDSPTVFKDLLDNNYQSVPLEL